MHLLSLGILLASLTAITAAQAPPAALGLRLEPRQAAVNAFVIESAERPKEE